MLVRQLFLRFAGQQVVRAFDVFGRKGLAIMPSNALEELKPQIGSILALKPACRELSQREAGAGLFVMDADMASFVKRHGGFSLVGWISAARPAGIRLSLFRSQYCIPWVMHRRIPI